MQDFINKNVDVILTSIIIFVSAMLIYLAVTWISRSILFNKKTRLIITGNDLKLQDKKDRKKVSKKLKKQNSLILLYKEYIFFGGNKKKFVLQIVIGYFCVFLVYFCLTEDYLLSVIFGITYLIIFYVLVDGKNTKLRKRYIKSFSLSLRTLAVSVEAGSSFPQALATISKRETIDFKIRDEFAILTNNLKSNKTLEQALDEFWKRNNLFQEFSMFVIVMQFYSKKGGRGLSAILQNLEKTLNTKIENYSEIDSEIGMYSMLFYAILVVYCGFTLLVKFFQPTFFASLSGTPGGYVKVAGSVFLLFLGVKFFKGMIRTAAEG